MNLYGSLNEKGIELISTQNSCILKVQTDKCIMSINLDTERSNFVWMTIKKILKTAILTHQFLGKKKQLLLSAPVSGPQEVY